MHRFVVDFERRPVAVNDLGYVAFRNPSYVLDLLGLGSPGALAYSEGDARQTWLQRATVEHGIETVMLYDEWFEKLPESWQRIGTLGLSRSRITPAWDSVSFYATSSTAYPAVRSRVQAFATTLPDHIVFKFTR
jgi:hypothetical protein